MGHYAKRFFNQNFILGDKYPATLIFSLRKIVSNYNGNCIQIRRSSDNALLAIGFDSNGVVDTAAILSFIGSGTASVRAIYDQSGSGKYLYNPVNTAQAFIASNGVIARDINGIPVVRFTGVNVKSYNLYAAGALVNIPELANQTTYSMSTVCRFESGSNTNNKYLFIMSNNGMVNGQFDDQISYQHASSSVFFSNRSTDGVAQNIIKDGVYNTNYNIFNTVLTNTSASSSINGINTISTGLSIATPTSNNNIVLGNLYAPSAAGNFYGNFYELIIWVNDTVANDAARIDIESNINKYYKLY